MPASAAWALRSFISAQYLDTGGSSVSTGGVTARMGTGATSDAGTGALDPRTLTTAATGGGVKSLDAALGDELLSSLATKVCCRVRLHGAESLLKAPGGPVGVVAILVATPRCAP